MTPPFPMFVRKSKSYPENLCESSRELSEPLLQIRSWPVKRGEEQVRLNAMIISRCTMMIFNMLPHVVVPGIF